MIRLTTFGGVLLRQDGTPHVGAASQRRRLALLVLIAGAGRRSIHRDKLLGYLWPETDSERARHALRQSLHAVQRALGVEPLFLGADALQLNPAVISSDVEDFEEAVEAGDHQTVVALFKGPFLDGFFVNDAPEFERWADSQRARYAGRFTAALEALAVSTSAKGQHAAAVAWWRRLVGEDPVSSRYALGLMRALAQAGDRTGALHFASLHQTTVQQELGAEPDPVVADFVAQLRAGESVGSSGEQSSGAAAAAGKLAAARDRARNRQRAWLDRALGDRFLLEAAPASQGAVVAYPAIDRVQRVPVEIHLLDPGVSAVADIDALLASLDRIAALREPHIVPLHDHGHADGIVYYVVRRPAGESLRDKLARERQLPVGEALTIADDVAAALACAHEAGVMHADLRPKHVFVSEGGAALAGIGIAEALTAATTSDRTSAALRMGSPSYQSPEQLAGDSRVDPRSDLYSLGCVLYEMLAGEVPFASSTATTIASGKLTTSVPSLSARRDTVSPELDGLVQRCLARAPSDRFRNAGELRAALAALLARAPR